MDRPGFVARVWWSRARLAIVLGSVAFVVVAGLIAASTDWSPTASSARQRYKDEYRRPDAIPYPSDNARTPARVLLGRVLFFDPRLSGSAWISCATCHNPGLSWSDGLPRAIGHGMVQIGRRSPTILNLAWAPALFWDGRAESLEEQALGPIASADEEAISAAAERGFVLFNEKARCSTCSCATAVTLLEG
jgi:cytochrome c peroxidase